MQFLLFLFLMFHRQLHNMNICGENIQIRSSFFCSNNYSLLFQLLLHSEFMCRESHTFLLVWAEAFKSNTQSNWIYFDASKQNGMCLAFCCHLSMAKFAALWEFIAFIPYSNDAFSIWIRFSPYSSILMQFSLLFQMPFVLRNICNSVFFSNLLLGAFICASILTLQSNRLYYCIWNINIELKRQFKLENKTHTKTIAINV